MTQLKIALISTPMLRCPPTTYGGSERIVWDLACGLTELGHKVLLFAPKGSQVPPNGFLVETPEPALKVETDWLLAENRMYDVYKPYLKDFDGVIHGHGWFGFEYILKQEFLSLHVMHTHHGHLHPNWTVAIPGVDKMNMCAISTYMATGYAQAMKRDVHFVYNGIDTDKYKYSPGKNHGDRLLYVGRFASMKGAHIALEVAKKADRPLDLVGGSFVEDPGYIEKIQAQCDGKRYRIFVDAPHEKKISLMKRARAFLFPSAMGEPFGLVGVEANACGTPVIALRDGAIPELIFDGVNGYVCDTADEMVEAVKKVDKIDPKTCRKVVEENFSRKVMAQRYAKKYEEILEGKEW